MGLTVQQLSNVGLVSASKLGEEPRSIARMGLTVQRLSTLAPLVICWALQDGPLNNLIQIKCTDPNARQSTGRLLMAGQSRLFI